MASSRRRSRGANRRRPGSGGSRAAARRRRRTLVTIGALIVVAVAVWLLRAEGPASDNLRAAADAARQALDSATAPATPTPDTPPTAPASDAPPTSGEPVLGGLRPTLTAAQAQAVLDGLTLAPTTVPGVGDYDRDDYGERWADIDGNGCNQRDDVLFRDVRPGTVTVATQGACDHDVLAGTWDGPYTGRPLVFDDLKDSAQAQAITIDHVVPLGEAHRSGAGSWPATERERFANDLDNLVATDGPTNSDKSDADPAEWRPPERSSWCAYALVWVGVKADWELAVDDAERRGLAEMLSAC